MTNASIALVDNYDSFTYNLYQYFLEITPDVRVFRNDRVTVADIEALHPDAVVISPGPKAPKDAGLSKTLIKELGPRYPIFGVCLGHQCINEVFGGRTVRAPKPWHGKTSVIRHDHRALFKGMPDAFEVARYHSLVADPSTLPRDLEVTAWTESGVIMGLRHRHYPIEGVQFHPESFMTQNGRALIGNFFEWISTWTRVQPLSQG